MNKNLIIGAGILTGVFLFKDKIFGSSSSDSQTMGGGSGSDLGGFFVKPNVSDLATQPFYNFDLGKVATPTATANTSLSGTDYTKKGEFSTNDIFKTAVATGGNIPYSDSSGSFASGSKLISINPASNATPAVSQTKKSNIPLGNTGLLTGLKALFSRRK